MASMKELIRTKNKLERNEAVLESMMKDFKVHKYFSERELTRLNDVNAFVRAKYERMKKDLVMEGI